MSKNRRRLPDLEIRFLDYTAIPDDSRQCWIWLKALDKNGYGCFAYPGAQKKAHRAAWLLFRGPIPPGMHCLHTCDTPRCVNPSHLFLGTYLDNIADMRSKGRHFDITQVNGENHRSAKLTWTKVQEIRTLNKSGIGYSKLSKIFNINRSCIADIIHNKSWKE